jgi:hypothetical protein
VKIAPIGAIAVDLVHRAAMAAARVAPVDLVVRAAIGLPEENAVVHALKVAEAASLSVRAAISTVANHANAARHLRHCPR